VPNETTLDQQEIARFLDQFITAVDFQQPMPIAAETRLEDLPEWDSLAALGVIVMCDTEYDVTITGDDLKSSITIADILAKVIFKKAS
jgi:acyl carrier protein